MFHETIQKIKVARFFMHHSVHKMSAIV